MGKGKPRTKEQPWYYQGRCMYFDGLYTRDGSNTPIHDKVARKPTIEMVGGIATALCY